MSEQIRENYFPLLKLIIVIGMEIYIIIFTEILTGAAGEVLLFLALFLAAVTSFEFAAGKKRLFFLTMEAIIVCVLVFFYEQNCVLLLTIAILDLKTILHNNNLTGYAAVLLPLFFVPGNRIIYYILPVFFIMIIYFQHNSIIGSYQKQMKEDILEEEHLKRSIYNSQEEHLKLLRKSRMDSENLILEERARISQALHDKLGHSINGSLYQLEACKALINHDKTQTEGMLQAVIDSLRGSMDEIRSILRREKPDKHKMALLQLYGLCDECKSKYGIETELSIEGDSTLIPAQLWEIILDNTFEAISNALKYAQCTRIHIQILIVNKLVRCTVSDNGIGAPNLEDGMGIAGMRKRVRGVNGVLDFETQAGFTINMLLPLESFSVLGGIGGKNE